MIKRIAHVGIAVSDLQSAKNIFEQLLGKKVDHTEIVEDQKVDVRSFHIGESNIELTGATSVDSPIAKFIHKKGEGIHHIAIEVDDLKAELARLKSLGIKLIDEEPRVGADNYRIAFVHPKSAGGVLIELCEKMKER